MLFAAPVSANECPAGYRLHYQGFCINLDDEQSNDPAAEIRGVLPSETENLPKSFDQIETRYGYKFSNMRDGEYCKERFVAIEQFRVSPPAAFALGDESCGVSDEGLDSLEKAKADAMGNCSRETTGCRIIFVLEN